MKFSQRVSVLALSVVAAAALAQAPASADVFGAAKLGPDGYKSLKLGMSESDAEATGLLTGKKAGGPCHFYYLQPSEGQQNPGGGVFVDPAIGVVMIGGTTKSQTPERIHFGSDLSDVKAAYPKLAKVAPYDFIYTTVVPAGRNNQSYRFAVNDDNKISDFALEAHAKGTCG